MENLYYINKQNVLTEKIKKAVYEMNYNVRILSKEVDMLEERIDKAIEYIKHSQNYGTMAQVMPHLKPYVNGDDLLEILGDKE